MLITLINPTSLRAEEGPDLSESKVTSQTSTLNKTFPTFLVTPLEHDHDPNYKNAILLPEAPGRAVCQTPERYIQTKNGYEVGKLYMNNPCTTEGFDWQNMALGVLAGAVGGALATEFIFHRDR